MQVIVQPRLSVIVLAREAQIIRHPRSLHIRGAEGPVGGRPHHVAPGVGERLGRAQVVGVVVSHAAAAPGVGEERERLRIEPDVGALHRAALIHLGEQLAGLVVDEVRGDPAPGVVRRAGVGWAASACWATTLVLNRAVQTHLLAGALAAGIIGVGRNQGSVASDLLEAAGAIVGEGARTLADEIAGDIILEVFGFDGQ